MLNHTNVDEVFKRQQARGIDVRWEGWNLIYFNPNEKAERSVFGRFRNGQYGYETILSPNREGNWVRIE